MITERFILSRMAVLFFAAGLPLVLALYVFRLNDESDEVTGNRIINIKAAVPEAGGFEPSSFRVAKGETVTLRFTSADVTHGIAIGPGLDIEIENLTPNEPQEITLSFDRLGMYTYYSNRWNSPDNWRMRGTIEVYDPAAPDALPPTFRDPVIENLIAEGVNIDDATHMGDHVPALPVVFERTPSAERGAGIINQFVIPSEVEDIDWRRTHTPLQALELLQEANPDAAALDLADVVAFVWTQTSVPSEIVVLYNKNCAACHGLEGLSDGAVADQTAERPVAFANLSYMFTRRADVFYAKIRRGGMGTDMPNFGTIFTPEETWMLVDYIWMLAMQE